MAKPMIYRWHGDGADVSLYALFVTAGSTRLLFSSRHTNTNGFKFSITYFIVVMNTLVD